MRSWSLPRSILEWISRIPRDRPIALLLRHSARPEFPPGDPGNQVPINEEGARLARELGSRLRGEIRSLRTSPVLRCVQTAELLRASAGLESPIEEDHLLGDPGVYVVDPPVAWANWQSTGHEGVTLHMASRDETLPGMAEPDTAAWSLVEYLLSLAAGETGLHLYVTHDFLVTVTVSRILGLPLGPSEWPHFLEGAFFWREGGGICVAYRGHLRCTSPPPSLPFPESLVIDFARRELARTLGLDSPARLFLAGGAYKSLLTGRPPRDLDIWAPSGTDRALLLERLAERAARPLGRRAFSDTFALNDRVVDVPDSVEGTSLVARLSRFDIALSAIGVEYQPGGHTSALIHPLARESVRRREVLLLKPLVNWKYALVTLERARRYADELGYRIPPREEAEVWRIFDSQPREMQRGMIERFDRILSGRYGVREEALWHLR